jgi:hypothetical protein
MGIEVFPNLPSFLSEKSEKISFAATVMVMGGK